MGSRKTAFSPTEELLCAQDVSPVGKDPEGFLHAQRPHLDKPLPSVTLGHNQASNDRGTHQPGGASWTPGTLPVPVLRAWWCSVGQSPFPKLFPLFQLWKQSQSLVVPGVQGPHSKVPGSTAGGSAWWVSVQLHSPRKDKAETLLGKDLNFLPPTACLWKEATGQGRVVFPEEASSFGSIRVPSSA